MKQDYRDIIDTIYAGRRRICTEGSKTPSATSSAVYIPQSDVKIPIRINNLFSVFTSELFAMLSALRWIASNRKKNC